MSMNVEAMVEQDTRFIFNPECETMSADTETKLMTFHLPASVKEQLDEMAEGSSQRVVVLKAMQAMGLPVAEEDLQADRRRKTRKKTYPEGSRVWISVKMPKAVRLAAAQYVREHPESSMVQVLLAGFKKLGMDIAEEHFEARGIWKVEHE